MDEHGVTITYDLMEYDFTRAKTVADVWSTQLRPLRAKEGHNSDEPGTSGNTAGAADDAKVASKDNRCLSLCLYIMYGSKQNVRKISEK